mmetsp:Transcript_34134/g.106504  ORF Transcript_34134/g.106504 Transcript_34134/m.106504 type:complete len:201 (+) Transcript_34134:1041-1643(+)
MHDAEVQEADAVVELLPHGQALGLRLGPHEVLDGAGDQRAELVQQVSQPDLAVDAPVAHDEREVVRQRVVRARQAQVQQRQVPDDRAQRAHPRRKEVRGVAGRERRRAGVVEEQIRLAQWVEVLQPRQARAPGDRELALAVGHAAQAVPGGAAVEQDVGRQGGQLHQCRRQQRRGQRRHRRRAARLQRHRRRGAGLRPGT